MGVLDLHDDNGSWKVVDVEPDLQQVLEIANGWSTALGVAGPPLGFSAVLAALVSSHARECKWFSEHLARRGVDAAAIVQSNKVEPVPFARPPTTTVSFREAIDAALAIAARLRAKGAPPTLGVRHVMAAYATCPDFHSVDFLRLQIDRYAWCLELVDLLVPLYPDEAWASFRGEALEPARLGFSSDAPVGADLLSLQREVESFARLLALRSTKTPVAVGVFGAWGAGKSFFMHAVRDRVFGMARAARGVASADIHTKIAQVEFNAWHYREGDLAASFVDHILHNLRGDPSEDDVKIAGRRDAILKKLAAIDADEKQLATAVDDTTQKRDAAKQEVERLDASLASAIAEKDRAIAAQQQQLAGATDALKARLADVDRAIAQRSDEPAARAVAKAVAAKLDLGAFSKTASAVKDAVDRAERLRTRGQAIMWGGLVLVIGAAALAVAKTEMWAHILAGVTAIGTAAATAATWMKKLDPVIEAGDALVAEQAKIRAEIAKEVQDAHATEIEAAKAEVAAARDKLDAIGRELDAVRTAPDAARTTLADLETQRRAAIDKHAAAVAEAAESRAALARVGHAQLLDEFLTERTTDDGYRKYLTIFSRIRNDFERLSALMTKADAEFVDDPATKPEPIVSRIVLYIDDLDRCAPERIVQVLELVHLMLAFPLFVCVVAVDPRSLQGALDKQGVRSSREYLEKIVQVPIWLRPMASTRSPAIARALFAAGDLTVEESEYLEAIEPLFDGNPRRIKRFVNMYRVVRAALTDSELATFSMSIKTLNKAGDYVPHRLCMALVALASMQSERIGDFASSQDLQRLPEPFRPAVANAFTEQKVDPDTVKLWFDRARRYSFYL